MNIQAEKAMIIERFRQVEDADLILAIKNLLDFALKKEKEKYEIPEAHQNLVLDRFEKIRKDPDRLIDWEEGKHSLRPE